MNSETCNANIALRAVNTFKNIGMAFAANLVFYLFIFRHRLLDGNGVVTFIRDISYLKDKTFYV